MSSTTVPRTTVTIDMRGASQPRGAARRPVMNAKPTPESTANSADARCCRYSMSPSWRRS